jgi:AcrR family transcriptional regulator
MAAGRPRSFDADKAVDIAMNVFWRKGYAGTSMADLTDAMGIAAPSLYAAFGNKESLFRRAMDRYAEGPAGFMVVSMEQPTAQDVVTHMLRAAAASHTDPHYPGGCFMVQSESSCGDSVGLRREIIKQRNGGEAMLHKRLKRAQSDGDLPADADTKALARYFVTVMYGMAVQAANGAGRKDLDEVVSFALGQWPGSTRPAGKKPRASKAKPRA